MIDLEKLRRLKEMVQTAEDFSLPWDYFFDHFGDHDGFLDLGKPVKSTLLTELCKIVAHKVYGSPSAVTERLWIHLKPYRFLHGSAQLGGQLAVAFYFTDLEIGMLSFSTPKGAQLMRFTRHAIKNRELSFPAQISHAVH